MKDFKPIITWLALIAAISPLAAIAQSTDPRDGFEVNPVLLDTKDGTGATLGLDFKFRGSKVISELDSGGGGDDLAGAAEVSLRSFQFKYDVSGTATAEAERNPKDFLNASLDGEFLMSSASWGSASGGVTVQYETDQSFDDRQYVYGLRLTYLKMGLLRELDYFGFDITHAQIDPMDDAARQAALGTAEVSKYYRTNVEVLYYIPLKSVLPLLEKAIEGFEFNYRYYHERNAPGAVKAAGIDTANLRTFRLRLQKQLFVAYSNGKLPFDVKEDNFFQLGFTYKLE